MNLFIKKAQDLLHKILIDWLKSYDLWIIVMFIQLWVIMLHLSKPVPLKKQAHLHFGDFQHFLGVTYSFKQ